MATPLGPGIVQYLPALAAGSLPIGAMYLRCLSRAMSIPGATSIPGMSAPGRCWASCPYKAVIFDVGAVLLPAPHRVAADWEVQNCIPAGTVQQAVLAGGENSPSLKYTRGELSTVEFLQEFGQQCFDIANVSVPVDSFLLHLIRKEMIKQLPIMAEAVQCIRAEGLKTAVLSHYFCLLNEESVLPLDGKQFDVIVETRREGMSKLDPRIYKLCLERLGVQPHESIFLDDISQNLKAAAQLGIKTVKVVDTAGALRELEAYLGFPLQGFVPYTRSVRPTTDIPKNRLQKYLEHVLGGQTTGPLVLRQFGHREPPLTYYVKLGDRSLVLKKEPPDDLLPTGPAVTKECRVLKALAEAGVPVPTVLALCEDSRPVWVWKAAWDPPSLLVPIPLAESLHSLVAGGYIQQQVQTWTKQYRAMETQVIPAMERLIAWLPLHFPESQKTAVVHGDFRLDNLIFHPERPEVLAVLGWKFSTLGDPISDVANNCMAYFLPPPFGTLRAVKLGNFFSRGMTRTRSSLGGGMSCGLSQTRTILPRKLYNWNFYMAFAFFRLAVRLQGLHKRSLRGHARPAPGESCQEHAELVADLAWDFAIKEGFRVFNRLPTTKPFMRPYSTRARLGPSFSRSYVTQPCPGTAHGSGASLLSLWERRCPFSLLQTSVEQSGADPHVAHRGLPGGSCAAGLGARQEAGAAVLAWQCWGSLNFSGVTAIWFQCLHCQAH
ncbi:PREDICTED: acyl-CoA dehydrogenase family member 10 [Tinamus guttatus]|uniref:acyl-CoA dehydrogenase family member 10 n=1 Tax=Tinamus guttatus TaxID=94827 RepID=UPI00052F14C6|nr:PREDICTED: acyl-CoA dehydrogenase family member 10 [Tinamus guttatus]